jgi:hypothetical protein
MSTIADSIGPQRSPRKSAHQALFDAADQWRVRADLETFFGPRADVFLAVYEKMRANQPARRSTTRTWSWPVFLGGFTWFFYRKMYTYAAIVIFLPMIFGYLFGRVGGSAFILFAIEAKAWYVSHALSRISKAGALGLTGPERADYLQRAGGVSLPAGIFAGLIYSLLLAFVIIAVATHKSGHA